MSQFLKDDVNVTNATMSAIAFVNNSHNNNTSLLLGDGSVLATSTIAYSSNLSSYVLKAGDTMTGRLTMSVTGVSPFNIASTYANANLNADLLDGLHAGNSSGYVSINNGTKNTNLNADLLDGLHAGNNSGSVSINNGTMNTNLYAEKALKDGSGNTIATTYLPLSGDATIRGGLQTNVGIVTNNDRNTYIYDNLISRAFNYVSITGTILIELPTTWHSDMPIIDISLYEYGSNTQHHTKIIVSGYNYITESRWVNCSTTIEGGSIDKPVRLGYNSSTSKCCILIGSTTSTWSYPCVYLTKVVVKNNYYSIDSLRTGYNISTITDESNITSIVTPPISPKIAGGFIHSSYNSPNYLLTSDGGVKLITDFAASSHTHDFHTDITNIIKNTNEFNFVPTNYNNMIAFNYRDITDATNATISQYNFYNGRNSFAPIKTSGYVINGLNNDHIVLAGGGTVLRSAYALKTDLNNYLPLSGGTLTGIVKSNSPITPGYDSTSTYSVVSGGNDITAQYSTGINNYDTICITVTESSGGNIVIVNANNINIINLNKHISVYVKGVSTTNAVITFSGLYCNYDTIKMVGDEIIYKMDVFHMAGVGCCIDVENLIMH